MSKGRGDAWLRASFGARADETVARLVASVPDLAGSAMSEGLQPAFDESGAPEVTDRMSGPKSGPSNTAAKVLESPHPEIRSEPAEHLGHPGMVSVWDEHGRIVGCMGIELWRALLAARVEL